MAEKPENSETTATALELLLAAELPTPPTKLVKQKRLSKLCGGDVLFFLRGLGYSRVAELQKLHKNDEEMDLHLVLAGVVEPNLKDKGLLEKYGALTPAELIKKMLLPGEITELSREVEILSGYRTKTIEEFKKK